VKISEKSQFGSKSAINIIQKFAQSYILLFSQRKIFTKYQIELIDIFHQILCATKGPVDEILPSG
jgi:hypothetical protein